MQALQAFVIVVRVSSCGFGERDTVSFNIFGFIFGRRLEINIVEMVLLWYQLVGRFTIPST